MSEEYIFRPPLQRGITLHIIAILILTAASGWGLWQASRAEIGPMFLLYLVPSLLSVVGVPVLAYRGYALRGAYYALERDGIRLHWGLRAEDIPMDRILWVRPANEIEQHTPLPWLRWPGSILGARHLPDMGLVEFMAAETSMLMLISTPGHFYAVSPADPQAFLSIYQRFTELGSLTPIPPRSVYPTFLLARVWNARSARYLLMSGLALSLLLLAWVGLIAPSRSQIILGFVPGGRPVPAVRLLLLPVINSFFFLADLFLGLFFYRRGELPDPLTPSEESVASASGNQRPRGLGDSMRAADGQTLAYLLWGSGALTPLLFLIAIFFILRI